MVARQRRVEVVGEQDALAADRVVGRQQLAQARVADLAPQVREGGLLLDAAHEGALVEAARELLPEGPPDGALRADARPPPGGQRSVGLGQDVVGRALEQRQVGGLVGHPRHVLNGAGPDADRRDALAAQVEVVVPPGRVEGMAGEVVDARDRRHPRLRQLAHRADDDVDPLRRAVLEPDVPRAVGLVPVRRDDRATELHARRDAELVGRAAQVGVDLGLQRVPLAPARVDGEGEGVQRRGDVAAGAGVGVVAPDATDVVATLPQAHVVVAVREELGGDRDAAEARTDDADGCHGPSRTWTRWVVSRSRTSSRSSVPRWSHSRQSALT